MFWIRQSIVSFSAALWGYCTFLFGVKFRHVTYIKFWILFKSLRILTSMRLISLYIIQLPRINLILKVIPSIQWAWMLEIVVVRLHFPWDTLDVISLGTETSELIVNLVFRSWTKTRNQINVPVLEKASLGLRLVEPLLFPATSLQRRLLVPGEDPPPTNVGVGGRTIRVGGGHPSDFNRKPLILSIRVKLRFDVYWQWEINTSKYIFRGTIWYWWKSKLKTKSDRN